MQVNDHLFPQFLTPILLVHSMKLMAVPAALVARVCWTGVCMYVLTTLIILCLTSASNNSYYGWDGNQLQASFSIITNFSNHFQSMKILVTFLISTSSNVSAPSLIQYAPFVAEGESVTFVESISRDSPPTNLPEGPYQHNFTLSRNTTFHGVSIIITPNTTFQWVAINRIIFCAAATEGLWSSPPLIHSTTLLYVYQ